MKFLTVCMTSHGFWSVYSNITCAFGVDRLWLNLVGNLLVSNLVLPLYPLPCCPSNLFWGVLFLGWNEFPCVFDFCPKLCLPCVLLLELLKLPLLFLKPYLELEDEFCGPLLLDDLSNDLSKDLFPDLSVDLVLIALIL